MIGGSGSGYYYHASDQFHQFGLSLSPVAGYFPVKNLAVGGSLTGGLTRLKLGSESFNYNSFGGGLFSRYYVPVSEKVMPFAHVGCNVLFRNGQTLSSSAPSEYNISPGIGLAYFITPNVSIEPMFNYDYRIQRNHSVGSGRFNLGFQVYLNRKKSSWPKR